MSAEPILVATRSAGKIRELGALFSRVQRSIVTLEELGIPATLEEEALENADSFEENALAKARYFASIADRPVVADDSGLVVAALGGRPGVLSKRWSGRTDLSGEELDSANNSRLISELSGVSNRRAHYVCVAAYADRATELIARGIVEGTILEECRGSQGFGYDPYFFSDELGKSFGEASLMEKELVSHRARAFLGLLSAVGSRG